MKKPVKYNTTHERDIASITCRKTAKGDVFYYVEYFHSLDVGLLGFKCDSLFTAVDIIKNNLQ